jgi:hypothetical protein
VSHLSANGKRDNEIKLGAKVREGNQERVGREMSLYHCCPWTAVKKNFKLVCQCHQLLSRFLAKGLPDLSVASVMSVVNDRGNNEMIWGAVHRSPGIFLTTEENPRKP